MSTDLETILIQMVESRPNLRLWELVENVSNSQHVGRHEVIQYLYVLLEEGKLSIDDSEPSEDVLKYIKSTYNVGYWILISLIVISTVSIFLLPQIPPYTYLYYAASSLFLFYLPGYSLLEVIYPKVEDLSLFRRFSGSIGLSLALALLIGFMLSFTPWGFRLNSILASLIALTLTLASVAMVRKFTYFTMKLKSHQA